MGTGGGQHTSSCRTFNQISQSADYRASEKSVSLTCCGGSYGGGSENLVLHGVKLERYVQQITNGYNKNRSSKGR